MANMEMLRTLCAVVAAVLIGFVVVPKLKAKGWLKEEDARFTAQLLAIVELIMNDVKFKDEKTKENAVTVIHVAQIAVKYVRDVLNESLSLDEKKHIAVLASIEALVKCGIEATEDRKRIIEITVDTMLGRAG